MPLGTGESGLVLPDTLTAAVKLGAEEISVTDSVYGSDGTDEGITEIPVPVTWTSQPEYDGNIAGVYTFTAEIPDFALTAAPPIITVTVYEGEAKGIITAFEELEEDVRWQNTWEPMLPEKVKGIVEGRAMDISVTWEADHEYNADSPEPGLYVFTAEIGGDYTLADGVEVLRIAVYIPETTGSATENDHLVITTANQLAEIADLVNRGRLESFIFNDSSATVYLELENDIDLSADGTGNDWTPIGTEDNPFKGNFDGNNKSINGLKINSSGKDYLGLFGYINGGSVKNIAVTNVDIYGKDYVGAVAGYVNNSAIESCYSTGSITGQGYVGGIAGSVVNGSMVQDCAALNSLVSGTSQVGRVVGFNNGGTLSGNIAFAGMDVLLGGSPKTPASDTEGIDGLTITAAEIKSDGTIGGLFTSTGGWSTQNGKLPGLFSNTVEMSAYTEDETDPYFAGEGTAASPFLIATAEQLAKLAELVNAGDSKYNSAHYEMIADIDLSIYDDSNTSFNGGKGWIPIGGQFSSFYGTFDGGQNIVTGLYINNTSLSNTGLFGFIYEGNVRNIGLVDVRVNGNSSVGGVAGYVGNGGVRNCYVTGSVSGSSFDVGGVVGYLNKGTVQNCYVSGNVKGNNEYVGGLVGYLDSGAKTENSCTTGTVSGCDWVGGVAGYVTGILQYCYSVAVVNGSTLVGGIAGYVESSGKVEKCIAINPSAGNNGVSTIGRIVGENVGSLVSNYSFSGMKVNGQTISSGVSGDINGEDISIGQIYDMAFWKDSAGWSDSIWCFQNGELPVLVNLSGQFKRNIAGAAVEVTGDLTYTGSRVEPTVEVIFVGIPLIEGIDYDGVTFSNNTNTGTAKVEVTGKGNFTGTISKEFTIAKADPPADVQRTIEVSEKYQHNYEVKLTELLPGVTGTLGTVEFYPAIDENNEGLLGTLNYSSGDTLILPVNAVSGVGKTAKVKVKVESTNYDDFNIVLTVKTIAKQEVNISSEEDDSSGGRIIASPKTPKTIINISGNVVVTEATAEATIDSRGKATAAFSQAQVNDAIDKAMKEAEKLGEGTKSNVVLKVEAPANVTTVQTSIPKEAVIKASKSGISSLTISTPIGDITFDSNALSTISKEAAGDIKSTISRVETSSLSPEAQRIIGGRPVFDITVTCGDKEISRFEGEVTVSVPYTPKEGEDINAIVIYHINASGELEAVSNCVYDPATGMVTFSTGHLSMYGVSYNKIRFKDVAESAWYSKAVTFISAREIATGTGGGNFSPEAKLTRGQFMVMLMKACGIAPDPDAKDNFADAGNTYYTGYLAAAKRLDISKGVGNNMFEPEKYITNQEMVTMLYNGLKTTGRLPEVTAGKPLSGFADAGSIAPWAYEAMKAMAESGIIGGNGGKLNPTGTTTRGEMAQVLYDLLSNR